MSRNLATDVALCVLVLSGTCLPGMDFIRGDANGDRQVSTADAHMISSYLFRTGESFPCADAADADDDGRITISDAVKLFHYLVVGEDRPPAPYPEAGPDTTEDEDHLGCNEYGNGSRLVDAAAAFRVVDATVEGGPTGTPPSGSRSPMRRALQATTQRWRRAGSSRTRT